MIWHIALKTDWVEAQTSGEYRISTRGMTLDEVGYIHCSTPEQIEGVAQRFYADLSELLLLEIDPDLVDADIIEEPPALGVEELFPHIWSTANRRGSQRSTVDQIRNWLATSGSGSGECHRAVRTLLCVEGFLRVVVASCLFGGGNL